MTFAVRDPHRANGNIRYKSRLCLNFSRGMCIYGERCDFAHGEWELQRGYAPTNRAATDHHGNCAVPIPSQVRQGAAYYYGNANHADTGAAYIHASSGSRMPVTAYPSAAHSPPHGYPTGNTTVGATAANQATRGYPDPYAPSRGYPGLYSPAPHGHPVSQCCSQEKRTTFPHSTASPATFQPTSSDHSIYPPVKHEHVLPPRKGNCKSSVVSEKQKGTEEENKPEKENGSEEEKEIKLTKMCPYLNVLCGDPLYWDDPSKKETGVPIPTTEKKE